jgi:predicted RecA/RadA family phage recombinase
MGLLELQSGTPTMVKVTPGSAVAAGDVYLFAGKACIAHNDIAAGELGHVAWPNGTCVYRVNGDLSYQSSEDTFAVGDELYVESDGETFSDTATSNTQVGVTTELQDTDEVLEFVHE